MFGPCSWISRVSGLSAGEYYVVADRLDRFLGIPLDGSYRLEWIADDVWNEVPLEDGVVWKRKDLPLQIRWRSNTKRRKLTFHTGRIFNLMVIMDAWVYMVSNLGAYVGINGGFFGLGCSSLDMVEADGLYTVTMVYIQHRKVLCSKNNGMDNTNSHSVLLDRSNVDWSSVNNAMGGFRVW